MIIFGKDKYSEELKCQLEILKSTRGSKCSVKDSVERERLIHDILKELEPPRQLLIDRLAVSSEAIELLMKKLGWKFTDIKDSEFLEVIDKYCSLGKRDA